MYRESYSEQPMQPNLNPQMNNYDYRGSAPMQYKSGTMEGMMQNMPPSSMHQSNMPMYYDGQNVPQMEQNPYMNMNMGMNMGGMMPPPVSSMDPNYDFSRYYWREMEQPKMAQSYNMAQHSNNIQYMSHHSSYTPPPPPNIVQRISSIIKSQLPLLQSMMVHASSTVGHSSGGTARTSRVEESSRRSYQRSRSRQKQAYRKGSDSGHDWLCRKCSFSNYNWRQNCKKCGQLHPARNFVPGPEDWKCPKCGNINYARRTECNRCKRLKNEKD